MDVPWGIGNAVAVVANGKDTGVVDVTLGRKNLEGPRRSSDDRVARSAIAEHWNAGRRFNRRLGPAQVGAELVVSELVDQPVTVAMAGELVPLSGDAANQRRVPFR